MTVAPKEIGPTMRCACCGLERQIYLDGPSAQQVCDACKAHNSRNVERIRELHRDWWIAHDEAQFSNYAQIVADLRAALRAEKDSLEERDSRLGVMRGLVVTHFEDAPIGNLQKWLQDAVVVNAHAARDSAFKRRDKAMRAIWRVDHEHNDDKVAGLCKCGLKTDRCLVWKALHDQLEDLDRWDREQVARLKAGKEHGLPREHPEVMKRGNPYPYAY
jgi:hypothetical protein